ncbi:MAG: hypothetical protein OEQ13_05080 [Acidobacteriota bacterium]|nr:hypothetical protein [Acidobacteriota bacterium]
MSQTSTDRLIDAIRGGTAPIAVRSAAARGALPLAPEDLVRLQVFLLDDDSDEIRGQARAELAKLDDKHVAVLVREETTSTEVLCFIAASGDRWGESATRLARRSDLPPEAALDLAACSATDILESLVQNQRLLGLDRQIGERLLDNPNLPRPARNRLLDYLDELDKLAAREGLAQPGAPADAAGLSPAKDPFLAALGVDTEVEALLPQLGLDLGALSEISDLLADEDDGAAFMRLAKLNVGQKLRVALFGTREERGILVRDTNRIIASTVVKNPKFSEQEADAVSKSRNVNEDVLRLIAKHRDFSRSYQIQRNLVCNPRMPFEMSMRLIPRLHDRDLKLISNNRNLPDGVRRQSKKILLARESRRRVRIGTGKR